MPQSQLLPLIVSQLKHYGFMAAAKAVAETAEVAVGSIEQSSRLAHLCYAGRQAKELQGEADDDLLDVMDGAGAGSAAALEPRPVPDYKSWFTTQHRYECRTAAFSGDGKLIATGSMDSTIKLLDAKIIVDQHTNSKSEEKKVIKTLYDHTAAVNEVQFHPNGYVLASCSDDCNIKLFDLQKSVTKRAFRYLPDAYPVRSISFHPSGDYLISGTDHHAVRTFDIHNMRCYIPPNPQDHHDGPILQVRYSPTGTIYASASVDGCIKLYDTVSGRCINTIAKAHGGMPSSRFLLSTGMDSIGRLWDLNSGKVIITYEGAKQTTDKASIVFTHTEDYVISTDEETNGFVIWNARTGAFLRRVSGHNRRLHAIAASPVDPGFVTCRCAPLSMNAHR
ncbi:WD40-repeat-containing domain protein [Entophlyctis helioformis]|nr:WD40-repeat-containing domain protein [Entophlyctis helioformis]